MQRSDAVASERGSLLSLAGHCEVHALAGPVREEGVMARPVICKTMAEAASDVPNGVMLIVPGFGVGQPYNLLTALYHQGARDITVVQNGAANLPNDERVKAVGNFIQD